MTSNLCKKWVESKWQMAPERCGLRLKVNVKPGTWYSEARTSGAFTTMEVLADWHWL